MLSQSSQVLPAGLYEAKLHGDTAFFRSLVIALTAFLSLVDLFATQAILPSLTRHYGVTPGAMGLASNASTFGMLVSGLAIGYFSSAIDRRVGILLSLVLLAVPTTLLAYAPNLLVFAVLRVRKGSAWPLPSPSRSLISASITVRQTRQPRLPPTSPAVL